MNLQREKPRIWERKGKKAKQSTAMEKPTKTKWSWERKTQLQTKPESCNHRAKATTTSCNATTPPVRSWRTQMFKYTTKSRCSLDQVLLESTAAAALAETYKQANHGCIYIFTPQRLPKQRSKAKAEEEKRKPPPPTRQNDQHNKS